MPVATVLPCLSDEDKGVGESSRVAAELAVCAGWEFGGGLTIGGALSKSAVGGSDELPNSSDSGCNVGSGAGDISRGIMMESIGGGKSAVA